MNDIIKEESKEVGAVTQMLVSRQAQEVQAAMIVAKKYPRDENEAYRRIMRSCARIGLAEQAEYTYPRGGTKVNGPSIRLAESIAQNWGNIDFGIIELENANGKSDLMAYAWDLETNTRVTKVFSVAHKRDTKAGSYKLTDSRDIYEATANFGARRVRACILGIIPGDIIESAVKECRKTIKGDNKTPIEDRIRVMLNTFEKEHRVTQEKIEEYLGCNVKGINENDLIKLRGVHQSIIDGMSKPEDYFDRAQAPKPEMTVSDPFNKATTQMMDSAKDALTQAASKESKPLEKAPFNEDLYRAELKAKHPHYDESYIDHLVKEAKAKW